MLRFYEVRCKVRTRDGATDFDEPPLTRHDRLANYNSVDPVAAAYHVLLYVDQLIELFLALDRVGVVGVKIVDGVFAFDAHVLGQLVGTGYVQLQTLGDFVC